jgi:hypothetical protein
MTPHLFHDTVVSQNVAGGGVYVYIANFTYTIGRATASS